MNRRFEPNQADSRIGRFEPIPNSGGEAARAATGDWGEGLGGKRSEGGDWGSGGGVRVRARGGATGWRWGERQWGQGLGWADEGRRGKEGPARGIDRKIG